MSGLKNHPRGLEAALLFLFLVGCTPGDNQDRRETSLGDQDQGPMQSAALAFPNEFLEKPDISCCYPFIVSSTWTTLIAHPQPDLPTETGLELPRERSSR